MNLFGEKNYFAVEVMSEEYLTAPSTVWGRLRIWCMGFPIGDIKNPHCGLEAVRGMQDILGEIDSLWLEEFEGLTDFALFELLDYKIYGVVANEIVDDARTNAEVKLDATKYSKFDFLTNWGEMFDHSGKCFIFKAPNNKLKILHRPPDGDLSTISLYCDVEAYQDAVNQANKWLDSESLRLKSNDIFKSVQSPAP
jgi:hypothetical protein